MGKQSDMINSSDSKWHLGKLI